MSKDKGKIIEIHRFFNQLALAQDDPQVQAWQGESFRAIGPYYEHGGKAIATGMDRVTEKLLMPDILGMDTTDKEYRLKVQDYFHSLITGIPKGGLKLQVGLEDDTAPISANNLPLNPKEWIIYEHAKGHPQGAFGKANAEKDPLCKFYIVDRDAVALESVSLNVLEDEVLQLYLTHKSDGIKVDQVLTLMGKNIKGLTKDDKIIKLKEVSQRNSTLNEIEQKEAFQRFIDVCKDKDLEFKYLVQELIGAQYLEKVGTAILIRESGEKIGDDLKEAVLYIKNPKNSKMLNVFKATYELKMKKEGRDYMVAKEKEKEETV